MNFLLKSVLGKLFSYYVLTVHPYRVVLGTALYSTLGPMNKRNAEKQIV